MAAALLKRRNRSAPTHLLCHVSRSLIESYDQLLPRPVWSLHGALHPLLDADITAAYITCVMDGDIVVSGEEVSLEGLGL